MYTCVDSFGTLKPSRAAFQAAATEVTRYNREQHLPIGNWQQDEYGWAVLVVWKNNPDSKPLYAYC